ncbi:MAG TPA: hypothetical protein VMI15_04300 [Burkholderiales bacterium]|nr:hypothetical protein [Burkholderiales bacterium]
MRILAVPLAALLAAASLSCAAEPFAVRLGSERIALDTPPGFSDTTDLGSPRLQDLAASLTSASNRILLFALTDGDMRNFTNGDKIDLKRYLIAVTPKGMENDRVSASSFATLVSDSLHGLGKPAGTADVVKFLQARPIGEAELLAELKRQPDLVSVLQGMRLPPLPGATMWEKETPQYLVFTTTLLLLRGKALRLQVYALLESKGDIGWLEQTTQRWLDELARLNR